MRNMKPKFCVQGNAQYRCVVSRGVQFMYIFHLSVTQQHTKWPPTRLCWPIGLLLVVIYNYKSPVDDVAALLARLVLKDFTFCSIYE